MNNDDHLLADVVAETLEQFAFLFVEPEAGTDVPARPVDYIQATIGFSGGGEQGTVTIAAPAVLCREMAGNILGQDNTEIDADVAADTHFPELDPALWQEVRSQAHPADARHAFAFRFAHYLRRRS